MRFYAFVLLAPLTCLAQVPGVATAPPAAQVPAGPKAPPEVDQALRARASAFLDYESKGENRKAYELVAEDSKDYYFGVTKEKAVSFALDEVQYGPDLSTATVRSTMRRQMRVAGHPVEVPQVEFSQWKLEKGQWVWYHDPAKDTTKSIIGPLPVAPVETTGDSPLPKDIGDKREREVAPTILAPRAAIDKKLVSFVLGKDGTEQVTFHNGNNGAVRVMAEVRGVRDTITVEPNDRLVDAQADLQFKITYKAHPESALQGAVLFVLEPFDSVYVLPVRLAPEGKTPRPGSPAGPTPAAPAPAAPAPAAPAPTAPAPAAR